MDEGVPINNLQNFVHENVQLDDGHQKVDDLDDLVDLSFLNDPNFWDYLNS
ncbi:unnamed protein product [Meloidogyne enterolobii]|uniref:Uncharacterized protein n=1 Tax=Meloidogyne enterolobii TaxID=390850 RepID=A0ACB0YF10_MELEN